MSRFWCGHDCPEGGVCPQFQLEMSAHWCRLCQNQPRYRQLWLEGRGPGQVPPLHEPDTSAPTSSPAVSLSAPRRDRHLTPTAGTMREEDTRATAEQLAAMRQELAQRHEAEDPAVAARALARLDRCEACPEGRLWFAPEQGIYCRGFYPACPANWHILLVKRLVDGLPLRQPCSLWDE